MKKLLIFAILIGALFVSSGQTYEQQSLIPTLQKLFPDKPMEDQLSTLEVPYWGKKISVEERGYYYFVEFLVRKSAHFFIFGLLATVIYLLLPKRSFRMLGALFFTLLFAIGDEYHQSLTGGRTASFQDVLLDMSGAVTFLIVIRLLTAIKRLLKIR
ncbi:VanZ family protein [Sporosarcina sp. HYO08]|uniref:VanZ family protein n=1 Tax=Sporosarcina sp. HYO08 TaxID=1759557 RepID=UPI0007916BEF|nr:VanZ family protein [Sporosarcina sp. HYO08]KXH86879.1 antibiotic resistance protein VanZ [Sporosarcina sp. HYO08]